MVRCELDTNAYVKGIKVSDAEMSVSTSKVSIQNGIAQSRLAQPKPQHDALISERCLSSLRKCGFPVPLSYICHY